jgi:hypothetical protein
MNRPRLSFSYLILGSLTLALGIGLTLRAGTRPTPQGPAAAVAADREALALIAARLDAIERGGALGGHPALEPQPLRELVAGAVAEELRKSAANGPSVVQEPAAATPEEAQRRTAAFETGRTLVERRLAERVWRSDDAHELRHLLIRMAPEDREELMTNLAIAINKGLVRDEVDGISF